MGGLHPGQRVFRDPNPFCLSLPLRLYPWLPRTSPSIPALSDDRPRFVGVVLGTPVSGINGGDTMGGLHTGERVFRDLNPFHLPLPLRLYPWLSSHSTFNPSAF